MLRTAAVAAFVAATISMIGLAPATSEESDPIATADRAIRSGDIAQGRRLLEESASGGNVEAQYQLGVFLVEHSSTDDDLPTAMRWRLNNTRCHSAWV